MPSDAALVGSGTTSHTKFQGDVKTDLVMACDSPDRESFFRVVREDRER